MLLPYTNPTPKLSPHRRLCISTFPQKTRSVWFISVLKSGDMGQCPHKSPSPCNTYVIPVSLYKFMSSFVTKTRAHTHTYKHTSLAHSRAGQNTIFLASKLRYKSTSNIQSFGGRGLNIFFSLIKAGISVRLSVCLHFYYVENRSSNRLHAWQVCCCDAVSHFGCNMDTWHVHN